MQFDHGGRRGPQRKLLRKLSVPLWTLW